MRRIPCQELHRVLYLFSFQSNQPNNIFNLDCLLSIEQLLDRSSALVLAACFERSKNFLIPEFVQHNHTQGDCQQLQNIFLVSVADTYLFGREIYCFYLRNIVVLALHQVPIQLSIHHQLCKVFVAWRN